MTGKRTTDVIAFLYARSQRDEKTGCLEWTAHLSPKGYGRLKKQGAGSVQAHRASFIAHFGAIPEGMCVLHRCDNRKCIEPSHLFPGTNADNIADRQGKRRQFRKYGDEVIATIRRRAALGEPQHELAAEYGMTQGYVSMIVNKIKQPNVEDSA